MRLRIQFDSKRSWMKNKTADSYQQIMSMMFVILAHLKVIDDVNNIYDR